VTRHHDLAADIEQIDVASPPALRRGQGLDGIIGQQPDITPGSATELSDDEIDELERCEGIIERGLPVFFEVGAALLRVRDLRLYRGSYATFEDYCQARWGFSKTYANNLIAATSVRNNLTTIVVKTLPTNEAQTRPLAKLKTPEQQQQAWQRAVETAPGGRVTAAHVAAVVRDMGSAASTAAAAVPAAAADTDESDASDAPRVAAELWPDSVEEIDARLTAEVLPVVQPLAPDTLHMILIAHRDMNCSALLERLTLAGIRLEQSCQGTLPSYPETQWTRGTLTLDAIQADAIADMQMDIAEKQQALQLAQARLAAVQSILAEYADDITRAHAQSTSDRSAITTPLLQALERVRRVIAAEPARMDLGT